MAPRRCTIRRRAVWGCSLAFLVLSGVAAAQDSANWNTSSGDWNNAANWDCVVNGASGHCIPGAGFTVTDIGGDITLNVDATVAWMSGSGGSLTLQGSALTATNPLGIQMTGGTFSASGSTVSSGYLLAQVLQLTTSTVTGSVQANDANIGGSTLGPLTIANSVTLANSHVGSGSNLTIGSSSSISNSTIGGAFNINRGAALTVANGATINATQTMIANGSLIIQGGSTFTATATPVFLGLSPGASALDLTGTGSVLNLTNTALELGQLGNSAVTVEHGGSIAASGSGGNFLIGLGAAFVTNSTMTVNTAGTASANNITVSGSAIGSTGVLSIADSSSSVTAAGQLLLASGGVVNASNGGSLSVDSLRIQTGSLTIDSSAALAVTSGTAVLIGSAGAGTLTLHGGGTASASGELVLGTSAGSSGALAIADSFSKWNGSGNVSVGEGGAGLLNVSSGGALVTGPDASGLSGSIGNQSTGNGTVTVQGGDWTAHGVLQIGAAGAGSLQLLQGGTVESGAATIGASPGSSGNVSVGGAGSIWRLAGALTVGSSGGGSLGISGAGQVVNTNAVIGDQAGSNGSVTVTGLGSSWQNSGILAVGGNGAAGLTIDAGTVTAGGASIGSKSAPVQVTVTNQGTLSVLGDVSIGGGAPTSMMIQNGGMFESGANASIGAAGGNTVVTVTGSNSSWTLHGVGNLTIGDKGSLLVMDSGTVTSTSISVGTNGLLNAQGGNILGSVVNNGGTVTAGDATGVMTLTGNYAQNSGVLLFEIDGLAPSEFDRLLVSGQASLTGGSIDIVFGGGFTPAAGETFDLLSATGGLSFANVGFAVSGLPADLGFSESVGANGLQLDFLPAAVPLPDTAPLLALGLGGLALFVGRRKAGAPNRGTRLLAGR